ncbi:MAG TPA: hypothetical protein VGV58_25325 [Bosea sp. (in: a-proteobacteria)]|jgi:hypothetical protein|nr:hypothetical protein [Bosea sp. (in: a-proteobacteria)]HEV2512910.1 hypothetical protein [Bosea sp. (in: a-proteobacteria)]
MATQSLEPEQGTVVEWTKLDIVRRRILPRLDCHPVKAFLLHGELSQMHSLQRFDENSDDALRHDLRINQDCPHAHPVNRRPAQHVALGVTQ